MLVSLYRTWRPKSFTDLVGQDAVVRTLRTALSSGKLSHAYLFSGSRGSGKTSAAKILARCLNCVHGPTPDPDNSCENCLAMLSGTALDVLEIDAASNRGIDEIRALRDAVKFAPASMRYKVFIVDEAHMLTREGANAFLKTLEEPPPHAIFILATTAPEQLPATILSRCQRYAFRRIPVATMIERMRTIADAEGIAIDDDALGAIAYRADGGLRDALTMLEQVAAFASGAPVEAATVDAAFGATGRNFARALVANVLAGDASAALRTIDAASDAGADMQGFIRNSLAEFRNLLVARIEPGLLSRDLSSSDAQATIALAGATAQPRIVRALRLLADALAAGRISGSPRLEVETAVLRLIVQGEDPTLEALATRVTLLEQQGTSVVPAAPAPMNSPASPAPAAASTSAPPVAPVASPAPRVSSTSGSAPAPPEPTLQRLRSQWQSIRTRAEGERVPLRGPLSRATVEAVTAQAVIVRLADEPAAELLRKDAAVVERAIKDVVGVPLRLQIRVEAGPQGGSRGNTHRAAPAPAPGEAEPSGETDLLAYALHKLS
ncbi:MAG TPA: DNA polymerase III subunit gamma/tau [Candidatus Acidoferrales bacterium]|nr:DNA polymerase III subunit gamma/tau [Candidatus Acidoferrales bacterium]